MFGSKIHRWAWVISACIRFSQSAAGFFGDGAVKKAPQSFWNLVLSIQDNENM
jgi:hypothetical protein